MNGHDDDFETAFDPADDERRRAQEEDMWLEYEADCAERGMRVGTAGWAWR